MIEEGTLKIWTTIYFTSLILAAFFGAISIVSGYVQHKISGKISERTQENVAIANSTAAKANEKASELENQNLELRSGVASLEKEATDSKLKYLEILERFSPRTLSDKQKQTFMTFMSDKIKGKVDIKCWNEAEANSFAKEIEQLLKDSGFETSRNMLLIPGTFRGLRFLIKSKQAAPPHTNLLYQAFKEIGLYIEAQIDDSVETQQLVLFVGSKPE